MKDPATASILIPLGQTLLLGAFAYTLLLSMRNRLGLDVAFERLIIAFFGLVFFRDLAAGLNSLSEMLNTKLSEIPGIGLKELLSEALKKSSEESGLKFSVGNQFLGHILGVWGVIKAAIELVFLLIGFILKSAKAVLWELLLFTAPLACGVFPVFPRMLINICIYAVELCLWIPFLTLIERISGVAAKRYLDDFEGLGVQLIAIEVVAILLMCMIPTVVHRFLTGAFSGDFNAQQGLSSIPRKGIGIATKIARIAATKNPLAVAALVCLLPVRVNASENITLFSGFITKVRCEGRLLTSSIGNEQIVQLEALPKEVGCAVLLKPLSSTGKTNLILETSSGSVKTLVSLSSETPALGSLQVELKGQK
ncbi:MAG: hypothetical protein AB7F66_13490 [Bacteriovoracia bacterium]